MGVLRCPECGGNEAEGSYDCGRCGGPMKTNKELGLVRERQHTVFRTSRLAFRMPDSCACCLDASMEEIGVRVREEKMDLAGSIASGGYKTEVTFEDEWLFPYCGACARHVRGHTHGWIAGAVAGLLVFGLLIAAGGGFLALGAGKLLAATVAGTLALLGVRWLFSNSFAPKPGPRCAGDSNIVLAWPDGRGIKLAFANTKFARRFAALNAEPREYA